MSESEITKKESAEITKRDLRGHSGNVSNEEMIIPRVKLMQALSPEVQEEGSDLKQGVIINSLTKTPFLKTEKGAHLFIPILRSVNWVKFNPRSEKDPDFDPAFEPGAIIWRSNDPNDPKVIAEGEWRGEKPPRATKFINYLCHFLGCDIPVLLSFAKTSFKAGRTLTTFTELVHANDAIFKWAYLLQSKKEQNPQGQSYYVYSVSEGGPASAEAFERAEMWYETYSRREVKAEEEHDEEPLAVDPKEKPWQ